ncbi:MAG: hypothetical protein LBD21_11590 [Tannerellaceae bacterium]|jgi:hypothetical protein|nr:hypothetical protein [Tannerellaceae bacterium]
MNPDKKIWPIHFSGEISQDKSRYKRSLGGKFDGRPKTGKFAFVRREAFQKLESLLSFGGKLSSFWQACFRSAGNFPVSGKSAFVRREAFQKLESLLSFGGKLSRN